MGVLFVSLLLLLLLFGYYHQIIKQGRHHQARNSNNPNGMQNGCAGHGEMAQWLNALTAPLKVLSSNPSNHMMAHNHL